MNADKFDRFYKRIKFNARIDEEWTPFRLRRFYPVEPNFLIEAIENAGFVSDLYRNSWVDLQKALKTDRQAAEHFLRYLDVEITIPRVFPIALRLDRLEQHQAFKALSRNSKASVLRALLQAHIDYNPLSIETSSFWIEAFTSIMKVGYPVVTFGDSHSLIFRQVATRGLVTVVPMGIYCGGGSAAGLANRDSRSGYGRRLEAIIDALKMSMAALGVSVPICFAFGQVDLEFVFTYRRIKQGMVAVSCSDIETFCNDATTKYLNWVHNRHLPSANVLSINPPCIDDEHVVNAYSIQMRTYVTSGVAGIEAGKSVEDLATSLSELEFLDKAGRTASHRLYNDFVRKKCVEKGLNYVDDFTHLLGQNGCIDKKYACAARDGVLQVYAAGMDIHIGGVHARAVKRNVLIEVIEQYLAESRNRQDPLINRPLDLAGCDPNF